MRLRDYVAQHGVDAFTFDDFVFVGEKVNQQPDRLILIGGQALEAWGVAFGVPRPTGDTQPLTEDLDWLGSKSDAEWLCQLLGRRHTDLQLAGPDDNGPSTALAYLQRPDGRVLLLDFLRAIVGPDPAAIQALAMPVRVAGIRINVLHPLHCLHSRLANLEHLPAKRKGNGPLQAEWAIRIAEAFIRRLHQALGQQDPRNVIRACHRIAELAEYRSGPYCYTHFGIDCLQAVPLDVVAEVGGRFETEDWPRTVARIERKRRRTTEKAGRKASA